MARHENSLKQIRILNENGYDVNTEELRVADGKYIYKQHLWNICSDAEKFRRCLVIFITAFLKTTESATLIFSIFLLSKQLNTIKEAGGLAVLAHSGQQQNFCLIPELSKNGLDGLEVNHHSNSESDKIIIRRYAEKYGLFLTGGSDFHGEFENVNVEIGDFLSELSGVEAVLKMEEE